MLKRRVVVGAKIESSYGEAETISATDCFLAYDIVFTPGIESLARDTFSESLGEVSPQPGARTATVTFVTDIYGSGTAGTAPPFGVLLRACGMLELLDSGVQALYQSRDTGFESVTVTIWQDGLKHVMRGCRGRFEAVMEMGQRGKINWTFEAVDFTYTDENIPEGIYSIIVPPVCLNQNFSIGGYSAVVPSLNIGVNNTLTRAPSLNETGGYARIDITERVVEGTISPEAVTVATHGFYTSWANGTKSDLTITLGTVAGNICKVTAPRVHYTGFSFEDRAGILAHSLPFKCVEMVSTVSGACDSTTSAGVIKDTSLFDENDEYNGARLTMTSGTYYGKARIISDVDASVGTATLEAAFAGVPAEGDQFGISKKEVQILFK